MRLLFLNDKLDFGAHNGKTIAQVLKENPSYINWAFKNTQRVNLSLEVSIALKAAMADPSYREKLPDGRSLVLSSRRKRKSHYKPRRVWTNEPDDDELLEELQLFGHGD